MSKTGKSQLVYLLRMLEYCGKIRVYLQGFTNHNDFYGKNEQLYFNASLTLLVQIGEQAARIDESLKDKAAGLPWPMIKGFRNIIVHEYRMWMQRKSTRFVLFIFSNCRKILKNLSGSQ